jgi:Ca2+:H+ antiporter
MRYPLGRSLSWNEVAPPLALSVLTVVPGRATRLQGGVHLVVRAAYVVLSVQP